MQANAPHVPQPCVLLTVEQVHVHSGGQDATAGAKGASWDFRVSPVSRRSSRSIRRWLATSVTLCPLQLEHVPELLEPEFIGSFVFPFSGYSAGIACCS